MKKSTFQTTLVCIFLLSLSDAVKASGEPFPIGAKSWGMANATVAVADQNSVFNNPAGLGFIKKK